MSVRVRPATVADASWMAELSRDSFAPSLLDYLVSAQAGTSRFWEIVLAFPASFPGRSFLVAESGDGCLGFADLALVEPGVGHLSYICVAEAARGRGVAVELLREYVERHRDVHALQLDVFDSNAPARALYDRLGFSVESTTSWWVADLGPAPGDPGGDTAAVRLDDLHTALARWDTYGFCEIAGTAGDRQFRFGLLGREVLRCFDAADLAAPAVVDAVRRIFPDITRAFVITPGDEPPASALGDLRLVNRSLRMTAPEIRNHLEPA